MNPEPELLRRIVLGDRHAFAAVVQAHQKGLAGFLARMGLGTAQVEDLVQETFLRAWQNLARYQPAQAQFSTWLYTIARRLALNALERPARRHEVSAPDDLPEAACDAPGPAAALQRRRRQRQLQTALQRLPLEDRSVLALAYVQELDAAAVARIEGANVSAVRMRLHRARLRLREALGTELESDDDTTG